ncbi:MAG: type II toxin-antitoxin system RelE/ParE family toxin [Deltaproteobacteria bacterium]|nr:type II toxin-antitoxin system RelE/ParE family toxin [Deltaproteobacteria bacterium]HDZ90500.1 type II toxin-antitoxin system RelE/ParE family toxin [Deltaproteobacteria bacterium]
MKWHIKYFSSKLEVEILALPDGLLARYLRLTDLMVEFGPNLGPPHTKSLGNGLFELRIKSKEGIARVLFCTKTGRNIIMLHVFIKKTQKTPKKDLNFARNRMNEVMQNGSF